MTRSRARFERKGTQRRSAGYPWHCRADNIRQISEFYRREGEHRSDLVQRPRGGYKETSSPIMADQSTSPKMGLSRYEVGSVLGMTAIFIITADREVSRAVDLSLTTGNLSISFRFNRRCVGVHSPVSVGQIVLHYLSPRRDPRVAGYSSVSGGIKNITNDSRSVMGENTACVTYMRLKHASGHYVACAVEQ